MLQVLRNRRVWRALLLVELIVVPIGLAILFHLLVEALPFVKLGDAAVAVATSFLLALAGYILFAVRLSCMLAAFRIRLHQASVWRIHLTSLFYYFFLPAGIGYDVSKVAKIAVRSPGSGTWHVTAAVIAERLAGGAGMYLLLLVALPLIRLQPNSGLGWLMPSGWVWILLLGAVFAGYWLVVLSVRHGPVRDAGPLLPALLVSVASHSLVMSAIWFVAWSLAIPAGVPLIVVAFAATLLLQLVPVNVLGVTLGEVAAVTVYLAGGLDKPEALLLATVAYSHRLIPALLGGMLEALGAWNALHGARMDRASTDRQ